MKKIFESGKFEIGCNYWASHAGIEMWHDWREDVVEADIARLEAQNIRIMRVFPLWSDFQPIKMHYAWANLEREMRIGEDLPDKSTPEGRAGIDPVMVERFETFCRIAEKHGMKLIVGLLTGWMSGRMFVPAALERLDLLNDAEAVMWEYAMFATWSAVSKTRTAFSHGISETNVTASAKTKTVTASTAGSPTSPWR